MDVLMLRVSQVLNRSIILMAFLAGSVSFSQGTWQRIAVPTSQSLNSVCFVDSLYGYVAGDSGVIFHTTDGGNTWITQDSHAAYDVEDLFFLNRNEGWASCFNFTSVPYGTILLKTTNGGATWVSQPYPVENIFMTCILYLDSQHGWMGGRPHALVKTTDGGNTWTQAAIDTSTLAFFPVLSIQFYNAKYGYASGGMFDIAGVTWHTSNGGDSWQAIDVSEAPADEVHGLHLFDSIHVMGSGGDPDFGYGVGMIRTSDGGQSWTYDELDIQGNAYDLDFRNGHEAWAPLGPKRKLIYSLDTGVTWTQITTPDNTAIYDMTFPDSIHGYAVGKDGAVLKFFPPVIPAVQPIRSLQPGFTLCQNNPNPVHDRTTIRFTVPVHTALNEPSHFPLQLKVFNVFGSEVACLLNEPLPPGNHMVTFNTKDLPEGVYFYRLQQQTMVVAGPMRLVVLH